MKKNISKSNIAKIILMSKIQPVYQNA